MVSLQVQLDQETARLVEISEAIEANEQVKELLAGSLDASDLATLEALQRQQESLYQRRDSMLEDLTRIQEEINDKAAQFNDNHELASEINQIQKEVARLEDQIETIRDEQRKTQQAIATKENTPTRKDTPMPRMRATSTSPVTLLVQHGELFVVLKNGQFNMDHLVSVSDGQIIYSSSEQYDVRTGAGLNLNHGGDLRAQLREVLGRTVTPRNSHLDIAIFENAFGYWEKLRNAIVGSTSGEATSSSMGTRESEGFRYRIVPFPDNVKVGFGGTSGNAQ